MVKKQVIFTSELSNLLEQKDMHNRLLLVHWLIHLERDNNYKPDYEEYRRGMGKEVYGIPVFGVRELSEMEFLKFFQEVCEAIKFKKPSGKEHPEAISLIIDHLNQSANREFRKDNKSTRSLINTLINKNFTIADIVAVIDYKVSEWLNDPEFSKYLAPDTLFGNKFEKYLNASRIKQGPRSTVSAIQQSINGAIRTNNRTFDKAND